MKKILSAAKNLIPAAVVIIVLVVCAAMPELGAVPDRLSGDVEAAETTSFDDSSEDEAVQGEGAQSTDEASGGDDALEEVEYEDPEGYIDGTYTGSAAGFGGLITVSVTIEDGIIASIVIVSAPGETESYLNSALAVIDSILLAQSPNVDAVSGATYSSTGIINAVKAALNKAVSDSSGTAYTYEDDACAAQSFASAAAEAVSSSASVSDEELSALANYGYADGTYTGEGTGFGGEIIVSVTVSGGQITEIEVVSADGETDSYWALAVAVIDEIIQAQSTDGVDAVSGATYSSNGILDAVSDALSRAASAAESTQSGLSSEAADSSSSPENTESSSEAADSSDTENEEDGGIDFSALANYGYADGTYTGTGYGYGGDVVLTVTVENGQITSIEVVSADGETYAYWSLAVTLLDTIILAQTWEVDAVSGATFSSEGIIEAVENALADALTSDGDSSSDTDGEDSADTSDDTDDTDDTAGTDDTDDENNTGGADDTDDADDADDADDTDDAGNTDNTGDSDDTDDADTEDSGTDSAEPVTETSVYTQTYSYTVTVEPDEDEDFEAYEAVVTITVLTTVVTVTDADSVTVTTTNEITDAAYESDADSTNLRYLSRAWTKMIDSLIAGEEVDAVSGATCSSNAILEAWEQFYAQVSTGTVTEVYETAVSSAAVSAGACTAGTAFCGTGGEDVHDDPSGRAEDAFFEEMKKEEEINI